MKTKIIIVIIFTFISFAGTGYGWASEHIGPLEPNQPEQIQILYGENNKPKGVDTLQKHPARVYSRWVNGREDIYYSADVQQANELFTLFSKLPLVKHICVIDTEKEGLACTFKQKDIHYNIQLVIPEGIYLHKAKEENDIINWPTEMQLILTGSEAKAFSAKLDLPKNVKIIEKETYSKEKTAPVVKGNTEFAFDLYQQLKTVDGNLFFSPYSISTALAMTYAGTRSDTAEQMAFVLNYPMHPKVLNPMAGTLIDQLNDPNRADNYQLSIANALWGQKDYPFLDDFIQLNKKYYRAGLENVDFVNEAKREKTRKKINTWVEDKTNDKIKDLIPEGVLDEATRLVLTNAIYFKGDWARQFDKADTKNADFYISPNKTVTAPLMYQKEDFRYGQTDTLQLLELPYKGDDLSMVILLPKEKTGLADLEKELTADNLTEWQKRMYKKEVEVYLPKFKMTSQFSLPETLKKMGMSDAFDPGKADFSGMTGNKDLFISAVLHKAFVEVNEEGTEAAAATGVMMELSMALDEPVFRADHPFIFMIKDNKTGSILFIGRIVDPTETGE